MAASRRSFLAPFASTKHSLRITFQACVSEHRGYRHHAPQARAHAVVIVIDEPFQTAARLPEKQAPRRHSCRRSRSAPVIHPGSLSRLLLTFGNR